MDNTCHKLKMLSNCIFLYKFSMDFHIRITTSCKSCKVDRGICLYCFSFQNAYSYFFIWLSKIEMTWPWFIRNTLLRLLYLLEAQLWRTRITTRRRKKKLMFDGSFINGNFFWGNIYPVGSENMSWRKIPNDQKHINSPHRLVVYFHHWP